MSLLARINARCIQAWSTYIKPSDKCEKTTVPSQLFWECRLMTSQMKLTVADLMQGPDLALEMNGPFHYQFPSASCRKVAFNNKRHRHKHPRPPCRGSHRKTCLPLAQECFLPFGEMLRFRLHSPGMKASFAIRRPLVISYLHDLSPSEQPLVRNHHGPSPGLGMLFPRATPGCTRLSPYTGRSEWC